MDDRAIQTARNMCAYDRVMDSYRFAERVFLLMPLMHSEDVKDVELCIKEAAR